MLCGEILCPYFLCIYHGRIVSVHSFLLTFPNPLQRENLFYQDSLGKH
jgi:hypothetical protein